MGAHERAGRFLEQLIRLDPEHDKAYYAYGQVLMHLGKTDEAEKAFAKHVEILSKKRPTSAAAMGE